jgi:restriction system protein
MKRYEKIGELSYELAYEALKYLATNGPSVPAKEVYDHIRDYSAKLDIAPSLLEKYSRDSSGPKYITAMNFKLVDYAKAGWLKKSSPKRGYWTITDEGIKVTQSNKPLKDVTQLAYDKYWQWKQQNNQEQPAVAAITEDTLKLEKKTVPDKLLELDPYEFQDLVAGLLEGMGYFIDFNAPRGKDGCIDLMCYRDPLGAEMPRMKVQCKHMPKDKISRAAVSQLAGVINNSEIGIFVTSGFYSNDAKRYAMSRNEHIRLIDGQELEDLWAKYYHAIPDDKQALPPIKFTPELAEALE